METPMRRMFFISLPVFCLSVLGLSVLGSVGCKRPELDAFERNPPPIEVKFNISPDYPKAQELANEYAAALRARLATRTTVVPYGVKAPDDGATLTVAITQIRTQRDPSPASVGVATGVAVTALGAMVGNRDAIFDGFFWGLWAGSNAAQTRDQDRHRLGFDPIRVNATVYLTRKGTTDPLDEFSVGGRDVIDQMDSLRFSERDDEARIREEEAKAFARVVVSELQERFHWLPLPEPRYYQPEVKLTVPKEEPIHAVPEPESGPGTDSGPKPATGSVKP